MPIGSLGPDIYSLGGVKCLIMLLCCYGEVLMLTRIKLKRGEGQLVRAQANPQPRRTREPFPPPSITPPRVSEEASSMSSREGEAPKDMDSKERLNLVHVCGLQGIEQDNGKESLPAPKDR